MPHLNKPGKIYRPTQSLYLQPRESYLLHIFICHVKCGVLLEDPPLSPSNPIPISMSDRASKDLAEASLPGEPRTHDATSKRSGGRGTLLCYKRRLFTNQA